MTDDEALAQLLAERGHGVYTTPAGGSIFLGRLPAAPDEALAVTPYPGAAGDAGIGYDQPRYQIAVRGGQDYAVTRARAQAVYDDLVGLTSRQLGDAWLVLIAPVQSGPVYLPPDEHDRCQFVINLVLHLHRPTVHRI